MSSKRCLVIYIGLGYDTKYTNVTYPSDNKMHVDMRVNRQNHNTNIFDPLKKLGYEVDTALVTNKHELYSQFVKEYNAIDIDYDEATTEELESLATSCYLRIGHKIFGMGSPHTGSRFLKLKNLEPMYGDPIPKIL